MFRPTMEPPNPIHNFALGSQFDQLTISAPLDMANGEGSGITTSPMSPNFHITTSLVTPANSSVSTSPVISSSPSNHNPNNNDLSSSSSSNNNNIINPLIDSAIFSGVVSTPSTTLEYSNSLEVLNDSKEGIEELCPVCGDKVSGYHYGLLTCESCKGFFKRTVQNKKVYTCVAERTCQIDKTQRKRCPFCRFQKCLDVGMKLEAVRADRMRGGRNKFGPMYKRDRARKMQIIRSRQYNNTGMISTSRGVATSSSVGITYSTSYSTPSPIKEEIQSPFLSSSTSSPDSSPAPMQGITSGHLPQSIPSGTTIAVTASGANATVAGNAEFSLWVGAPVPQNTPSSSNSGTGGRRTAINTTANTPAAQLAANNKVPALVRHLLQMVDDAEWQTGLYNLIQSQTYNQCNVDLFELLCKVLDQNLFSQVDWARNSFFFKELRVDDQMKLLQYSWSDLLILDHLHQRIHNKLQDEITLPDGQTFDLLSLALLGTTQFSEQFQRVLTQMSEIQFDVGDYICMKFVILLNPGEEEGMRSLSDRRSVVQAHDQVRAAFQEYCRVLHPEEQDRYDRLMAIGAELHYIADNGERYLYMKHVNGAAPGQTLLMELLHNRRR